VNLRSKLRFYVLGFALGVHLEAFCAVYAQTFLVPIKFLSTLLLVLVVVTSAVEEKES
jgi:hypothetical protein